MAGINKMVVRIANREDPDQTAVWSGSTLFVLAFWQATSVRNLKHLPYVKTETFTFLFRAINYDEKDPFLCNACGFCKYAKFDFTLTAKPCCAVDPIENEDDRKKVT